MLESPIDRNPSAPTESTSAKAGSFAHRVLDQLLGSGLLFGGDPGDAGEVDWLGRIPGSRPDGGSPGGDGVVAVIGGHRRRRIVGVFVVGVVVRPGCADRLCSAIGDLVGVFVVGRGVGGDLAVVLVTAMVVGRRIGETWHHQHPRQDGRVRHRPPGERRRPSRQDRRCRSDADDRENGRRDIGELRSFGDFEAGDPRDTYQSCGHPAEHRDTVDSDQRSSRQAVAAHEPGDRDGGLCDSQDDEYPGQTRGVGVDAGRRCVDDRRTGRCDGGHRRCGQLAGGRGLLVGHVRSLRAGVVELPALRLLGQNRGGRFSRSAATPSRYSSVAIASSRSRFESATEAPAECRWRS